MRKIGSLFVFLVILVIAFGLFFVSKPKEYTKASNKQTIEKSCTLSDNKPPVKNPDKTKPTPLPPPKNKPGGGGSNPTDPKIPPKDPGPDPTEPCPGCGPKSHCG